MAAQEGAYQRVINLRLEAADKAVGHPDADLAAGR